MVPRSSSTRPLSPRLPAPTATVIPAVPPPNAGEHVITGGRLDVGDGVAEGTGSAIS